jgi:PAS domain S-box-containing protein
MLTSVIQHHTQLANLRLQQQEQLRTLKMYEAAQEAIQDSVIVLSPDLKILRMNHSAEITLGYSSQEVRGQPFENVLIGAESLKIALEDARKGKTTYGQGETRLYRRSGLAFLAQMITLPVLTDEEVQGVVILIQDLSEKEQIQVHAQQLEQRALLGEVTAVFAHEVRNR